MIIYSNFNDLILIIYNATKKVHSFPINKRRGALIDLRARPPQVKSKFASKGACCEVRRHVRPSGKRLINPMGGREFTRRWPKKFEIGCVILEVISRNLGQTVLSISQWRIRSVTAAQLIRGRDPRKIAIPLAHSSFSACQILFWGEFQRVALFETASGVSQLVTMTLAWCVIIRQKLYRGEKKCLQILLSYSQVGQGRKAKQGQEEISRNHVQAFQ